MEIDVTHMVLDADEMIDLSGSCAEHGQDASKITWNNSLAYVAEKPLLTTDEEREAARAHFRGYGAWSEDEIAAWSEEHLQAITCQDVAASIRELDAGEESYSGLLGKGDDGHWYFYLGL